MSRASNPTQRNLSLTEELEKLEQSITLTLQEIDHNFSRSHRIVTTSILPTVAQYAAHSKAVWDGSKVTLPPKNTDAPLRESQFWKQFFEASANVSLSGYEELATSERGENEESETFETTTAEDTYDDTVTAGTPTADITATQSRGSDSPLSSPSLTSSTPRGTAPSTKPAFAPYPSAYEALKDELSPSGTEPSSHQALPHPSTPQAKLPSMNMTPGSSSPFSPAARPSAAAKDPLLHRVLDKNYRLLATPHSTRRPRPQHPARDLHSPLSSPSQDMPAAPTLHAEIFSSPPAGPAPPHARTPGVSVLHTPGTRTGPKGRDVTRTAWDSDSDDDSDLGLSPPKTMHFAVPRQRLLRTPAREASKRIVDDLLLTAGAGGDGSGDTTADFLASDDDDGVGAGAGAGDDSSLGIIRGRAGVGDESF
ncbi:MAG: DASH complex subunit ask1 [Thelocarpon impressellum]|nr:MAG: DASH complex subunit ask1 [Thelocarpon impressellum]